MKPVAYFLCALALALIIFSPLIILSYYEKLPEPESFKGILTLWHITGWRTGGASAASFLEKRIAQYEASNPHIFIELICLSEDEATAAIAENRLPDIISYPYDMALTLDWASLPARETLFPELPQTAYPYMCGSYCILINTDMASESGITIENSWGLRPDRLLDAAQLGMCFDAEAGFSALPALAFHTYPPTERPRIATFEDPAPPDAAINITAVWQDGLDLFCKSEAGVLVASHRQLFEATQRYERGEAPAFNAYAIGGYTDMVQLIGVIASKNEPRQKAGEDFSGLLVSESAQEKLEPLGTFPTVSGIELYAEDTCRSGIYEQLCKYAVLARPEEIALLKELALAAYEGDESSLKKLRRLLRSF